MQPFLRVRTWLVLCCLLGLVVTFAVAQWRDLSSQRRRGGYRPPTWRPRRMPSRDEFPTWEIEPQFNQDVFTFVRIQYDSFGPFGWWDRWDNDYPDGDWNFSHRLQQLTSLQVSPDGRVMRLTDPELFDYPFIYMAGVQTMILSPQEQVALRRYLLNGGFLMMDDFWAPNGWENVRREMRRVLPNREPRELTLDHPIFSQCLRSAAAAPSRGHQDVAATATIFEHWHGSSFGDEAPHFWSYFDDQGRMVALLCHNNDLGDGWEREGENEEYFRTFSEKWSYPLGINVVTYAMTH